MLLLGTISVLTGNLYAMQDEIDRMNAQKEYLRVKNGLDEEKVREEKIYNDHLRNQKEKIEEIKGNLEEGFGLMKSLNNIWNYFSPAESEEDKARKKIEEEIRKSKEKRGTNYNENSNTYKPQANPDAEKARQISNDPLNRVCFQMHAARSNQDLNSAFRSYQVIEPTNGVNLIKSYYKEEPKSSTSFEQRIQSRNQKNIESNKRNFDFMF